MASAPVPIPPTLGDYVALMDAFVAGQTDGETFERRFLDLYQNDETFHPPDVFAALEGVFWATEDFYADPALRDPGDLDEEQLRERVGTARQSLQALASPA